MLARIYGLFTLKTSFFAPLTIMVMQNTFQSSCLSDCILKFDLKGSLVGRNVQNITSEKTQLKLSHAKSENDFFSLVQTDRTLKDINYFNLNRLLKSI